MICDKAHTIAEKHCGEYCVVFVEDFTLTLSPRVVLNSRKRTAACGNNQFEYTQCCDINSVFSLPTDKCCTHLKDEITLINEELTRFPWRTRWTRHAEIPKNHIFLSFGNSIFYLLPRTFHPQCRYRERVRAIKFVVHEQELMHMSR